MKILEKGIIKIKICKENTYVKYKAKYFMNRKMAIETVITHLKKVLEEGLINDKNTT